MRLTERFKRDIMKHPARASLLGVLTVVMVALMVRAGFELQPKALKAGVVGGAPEGATQPLSLMDETEARARVEESKKLWPILREARGVEAAYAFTFDARYFPPDPSKRGVVPTTPERVDPPNVVTASPPVVDADAVKRARAAAIREQSRGLVVKSTTVGNAGSQSMAIVNQQLLTVGQEISGFEITAIRAREVEFVRDGVTIAVKMADDPRGQ